jgi:hypothetical protein
VGVALVSGLLIMTGGCGPPAAAPIGRDEFIDVMVELRKAAQQHRTEVAFDARKAVILRAAGVTDSALLAFVRAHEADPAFMSSVWEAIDARVNLPPDSLPPDSARGAL